MTMKKTLMTMVDPPNFYHVDYFAISRYSICHLFTMLRQRLLSAIDLLILVHFISEASAVGEHMEAFFFKEIPQYRGNNKGGVHAFLLNTRGCWHSLGQNGWAWLGCIREGGYTGHSLFHDSFGGIRFSFPLCLSLIRDTRIPLLFLDVLHSLPARAWSITLHSLLYCMLCSHSTAAVCCVTCTSILFCRNEQALNRLCSFVCYLALMDLSNIFSRCSKLCRSMRSLGQGWKGTEEIY